jgi:aryl sulfotransferase
MNVETEVRWPQKVGELDHPAMDSTRWNDFAFRDDDIVVATFSKSGTTLIQQIVAQLLTGGDPAVFGAAADLSPWIDFRVTPDAPAIAERLTGRRVLKTHLPLQFLVYSPRAKYIVCGRDPRDVIWSLHNHLAGFRPGQFGQDDREGVRQQFAPAEDVRQFYNDFIDGRFPMSIWPHVQGWWDARGLPNLLLLHYADLIGDLPGQIRNIAAFLDIPIDESRFADIVDHCSLDHTRKTAADDPLLIQMFKEGATTFINKGVNGRWREVLSQDEIDKAERAADANLTPDCADWLLRRETGKAH